MAKKKEVKKLDICPICKGSGLVEEKICPKCKGTGKI